MNRIKCFLGVLVVTVFYSASAQLLFTNLPASITGLSGLTNLQAVIYGGNSNFVAVGANEAYTCGSFQANQTWLNSGSWVTKEISSVGLNLDAITLENNIFIATGDNSAVFNAPNAVASTGLVWSTNAFHIFPNTAVAGGIAYNSNVLVAVAEANEISYSSTNLPTATTWPQGSTPGGFSIIESFRGVVPYGTSGFVACGIFGDVRFSSNGSNWQAKANGAVGESDLFGIASAGQTLVAVGSTNGGAANNGAILFSTDGGTAWQQATNPPGGLHPLNAVAYTSPGFITVGNNGQILTSSNGIAWTLLTNTVSATNLNGVAFATNGLMAGVGELVGNSGTVILAGYAPGAPINPIGQTNCATSPNPPNNELSVNVATDANHPPGTVTVDWYDALGHLLTNSTTTFFPTNNPNLVTSNAPVTFTFNAVERDLRTGFTSAATPVTLEINPRPTTTLVPLNATDCNVGDSFVLTNTVTGIGPWTVSWNDGMVQPVLQAGPGPVMVTRTVFPTNTLPNTAFANIYYVTNVTSADTCLGNLPGDIIGTNTIIINPRPTAALAPLNVTDCDEGNPYGLSVALTGIGPWTVYWNDGTVQTANSTPLTRTVFPTNSFGSNMASNYVYFVTIVSNDDTCEGNEPGDITGTNTIIINPLPTVTLTPLNVTNCNVGTPVPLNGTLTGIGPWTITWNDGTIQPFGAPGQPGPLPFFRIVSPTNTLANTASNNVYYVTTVIDNTCIGNQPGDLAGTNSIVVNPRPTASLASLNVTNCNVGDSFALMNTLTGIGPWTVFWNDGTVQTVNGTAPLVYTRTVFPTNSFAANTTSNNVYFVTVVSNNDTCEGNEPGDITGTNTITINPLPTVTLTPLNVTNCNDGTPVSLNGTLTGIGPWTVTWNDGTIQPIGIPGDVGPLLFSRTVSPTNTLFNTASNNVYFVTVVSNNDTCEGNQPGDIVGTNSIVINPRPTASLAPLNITNCNNGSSFVLTGTLTGIGPWVVTWNDGLVQTNLQIAGPAALQRTVSPTNLLANAASNYVYYLTSVADSTCVATEPGDITGTNLILINPLSTATLTISTNDFAVSTNGVSSGLLETVSNPSGSTYKLTVGFQSLQNGAPVNIASQTLSVTNHLAFTGIGPWTVVLADGTGNTFTNTFSSNGNYVWQETISTNFDTNFTFSVQSLQSTNTGCSAATTASYDVLVYDAPTASVYTTNTLCGSVTNLVTISATLGGFGPWTNVVWSDGFTNALVTSNPLDRTLPTPTNGTLAQIITNYSIVSLTDMFGARTTSGNDLIGSAEIIVDPYSSSPPVAQSSLNESCATVPIPLSVTVPAGFTANWFDVNTNLLTNGVTVYTPPAPAVATTNIYLVAEIYNDTNLNDGCDSPFAVITNIFENCSQTTSISLAGTNVVISWNGNFILQSTTNLLPPTMWMNVYTGALGPNFLTNSVSQPPVDFFRLYSPTN